MKTETEMNVHARQNLIFIFSLPRSGSTLLQRLLSAHTKIKTYAEPYLLLPLAELDNLSDQYWFYGKRCNTGVQDLVEGLPGGRDEFNQKLNKFIKSIYFSFLEPNEKYFLDKTPHNYYIISQISDIFPDAKFIFIFRNPLAVYSSFKQSFYRGHNITNNYLINDLYMGPGKLYDGYALLKNKAVKVIFRDLLTNPERELNKIMQYLDLDYEPDMMKEFQNVTFKGHVNWDKTFKFNSVTSQPVSKWKKYTDSWFEKSINRKYITSIDE